MQVQINSDSTISMHNKLSDSIGSYINNVLQHFEPYLMRVDVHLTGENNRHPNRGPLETRCLLEVRPRHYRPLVASSEATDIDTAFSGAAGKMHRLLENTFGRLTDKRRRAQKMEMRLDHPQSVTATRKPLKKSSLA
ncbi:MAG: HPF/RaiA family ribosome-associated protein [Edaphobacter sp.]